MSRKEHISVPFFCSSCAFSAFPLFQVLHACNPYLSKTCVNRIIRNKNEQSRGKEKKPFIFPTPPPPYLQQLNTYSSILSWLFYTYTFCMWFSLVRYTSFSVLHNQPINSKAIHENCVGLWEIEQKRNELVFSPGTFEVRKERRTREKRQENRILQWILPSIPSFPIICFRDYCQSEAFS